MSDAVIALASRLADSGDRDGGLAVSTPVLDHLDAGVRASLGIPCAPLHGDTRIT